MLLNLLFKYFDFSSQCNQDRGPTRIKTCQDLNTKVMLTLIRDRLASLYSELEINRHSISRHHAVHLMPLFPIVRILISLGRYVRPVESWRRSQTATTPPETP